MPVIGLKFDSIDAKRKKEKLQSDMKVNTTPKIVSMKETELGAIGKKAFAIGFEITTDYNPDIAQVKITGEVLYVNETQKDEIMTAWKKEKKLPENVGVELLNHLFRHCLLKIATISEDLQLPPPLNFPMVKPKSDSTSYIG